MRMRTREYKVGFKHSPQDLQETMTYRTAEAAYAFALSIEINGGVAVVMPGYKGEEPQRIPSSYNLSDEDN